MTLPVSSYEELLVRVRSLTHETIQLRRELTSSLSGEDDTAVYSSLPCYATHPQRRLNSPYIVRNRTVGDVDDLNISGLRLEESRPTRPTTLFTNSKESEAEEQKDVDEGSDDGPTRSDWVTPAVPPGLGLWHSGPSSFPYNLTSNNNQDSSSVISFTSSVGGASAGAAAPRRTYSQQQLGAKVEMVYNLLSMLGTADREDMSKTLLAMSSTAESCQAMRQSGCVPLLIQLMHAHEADSAVRVRAQQALNNVVNAQTDEKRKRRESRVLKLLNTVREHCDALKLDPSKVTPETHPSAAVAALMKFSFDAEHRQAMCTLGGLHAIAELIQVEHEAHGSASSDTQCVTLRRYAGMALTNLTFGDGANKALLCSFTGFMEALVAQLTSPSEDLRQVTASVIRNLSWRADGPSKTHLREVGAVTALMTAAMDAKKEATLKSILSALWNLSAHCSMNKVDICSVEGALSFLVRTLRYKPTSTTLGIIENAGGILRNVSSHVAVRDDYRQTLRDAQCFEILLEQLKSPSLTVVSNACGTLWNLSARCAEDQRRLWDMGATSMLRSLVQSKHKMIAMGSSAALKNLLAANPNGNLMAHVDSTARSLGLQNLPTLSVRKQRALEQQLDATLAETCDNMDNVPKRSESKESVTSTQSDSVYERVSRGPRILDSKDATLHDSLSENGGNSRKQEEDKLLRRYRTSGIPKLAGRPTAVPTVEPQVKSATARRGIPVLRGRPRSRAVSAGPSERFSTDYPSALEEEATESPTKCSVQDAKVDDSVKASPAPAEAISSPKPSFMRKVKCEDPPIAQGLLPAASSRGLYAETDLDQPTNFSLKYGEEISSDEDAQGFGYYDSNKLDAEDTTRTYFTEGTPYDGTPYNFSGATSMSDLRIDPSEPDSKPDEKSSKESPLDAGSGLSSPGSKSATQEPASEVAGVSTAHAVPGKQRERSESGLASPERPVRYCEEGTPADCISRVSSLSSLTGKDSSKTSPGKKEKEGGKVVTFNVDETPLMFSRSSSLTSLNSLAPPLPDGASSVVSTLSRLTSGAVSPSELPDSPTQMVPPSTHLVDASADISVFDDACQRYQVEGTPLVFSGNTSLSGLSFDDSRSSSSSLCGGRKGDQTVPENDGGADRLELASVSECDEADDDILADCISVGMQDTRNRPRLPSKPLAKTRPCIPVKAQTVYEDSVQTYHTEGTPANISHAGSHTDLSALNLTAPSAAGHNDTGSTNSSDTENILNECIHSGMPQARTSKDVKKAVVGGGMGIGLSRLTGHGKPPNLGGNSSGAGFKGTMAAAPVRDEVVIFDTENSPCTFSTRSSLSDITINTDSSGQPAALNRLGVNSSQLVGAAALGASPGSFSAEEFEDGGKRLDDSKRGQDEWSRPNTRDASFASVSSSDAGVPSGLDDLVTALSHQPGLSQSPDLVSALSQRSLSVESLESCEPTPQEQALLEQCIHSGMPHRSKNGGNASVATPTALPSATAAGAATWSGEPKEQTDIMTNSHTDVMAWSFGNHTWSDDVSLTASGGSGTASGGGDADVGLVVVDGPKPTFRVGAGVTPSPLAKDYARICREIRKIQETQCGMTSLTSELSLISSDSYLDAELCGLEGPDRPTPDFLASEEHPVTLKLVKMNNDMHSANAVSLRLDGHPDVDLENSMVSVASITSEIADASTLAADSDTEVPDDEDLSILSQEDLPIDTSSPKVPRRLTPKDKRRTTQERYRTYTVEELKQKCAEEASLIAAGSKLVPNKITPKQRRLNDKDRFLTRTISLEEEPERKYDTYRVHKDRNLSDIPPVIRPSDHVLNGEYGMSRYNGCSDGPAGGMTTAERLEFVANATLVAQCLNADDYSIDTHTYVAQPPHDGGERPTVVVNGETDNTLRVGTESDGEDCHENDLNDDVDDEVNDDRPKGPRITLPGSTSVLSETRGIRGRRKPLYTSPATQRVTKSSPPSPKISVLVKGSPTRVQLTSDIKEHVTKAPHPPPLVREGTFTKEEISTNGRASRLPELRPARPVGIPRPASVPTAVRNNANVTKQKTTTTSHKRNSSAGNTATSSQNSTANGLKRQSSTGATAHYPSTLKTSSSNHSIKSIASVNSVKSIAASPEKSKTATAKPKTPKKEVTSKIANLWKKVEESKKKDKSAIGVKDKRVWITNSQPTPQPADEVMVIEQEQVVDISSGKIVRSSTFQGDSKPPQDLRGRTVRNSGDFSTWESKRGESRNVVAAVVAPYNYSPPQAKSQSSNQPATSPYPSKVTSV